MPYALQKLTPNLIVSNVERSLTFYCDVLGLKVGLREAKRAATIPSGSSHGHNHERDHAP